MVFTLTGHRIRAKISFMPDRAWWWYCTSNLKTFTVLGGNCRRVRDGGRNRGETVYILTLVITNRQFSSGTRQTNKQHGRDRPIRWRLIFEQKRRSRNVTFSKNTSRPLLLYTHTMRGGRGVNPVYTIYIIEQWLLTIRVYTRRLLLNRTLTRLFRITTMNTTRSIIVENNIMKTFFFFSN